LRELDLDGLDADQIVEFAEHGVSPKRIAEIIDALGADDEVV
jgi:hypothetical protein